jgi:hypothetical protein
MTQTPEPIDGKDQEVVQPSPDDLEPDDSENRAKAVHGKPHRGDKPEQVQERVQPSPDDLE